MHARIAIDRHGSLQDYWVPGNQLRQSNRHDSCNGSQTLGFGLLHILICETRQLHWRGKKVVDDHDGYDSDDQCRRSPGPPREIETKCTIFLGCTSNMMSCGNREVIRYLVQNRMVRVCAASEGYLLLTNGCLRWMY